MKRYKTKINKKSSYMQFLAWVSKYKRSYEQSGVPETIQSTLDFLHVVNPFIVNPGIFTGIVSGLNLIRKLDEMTEFSEYQTLEDSLDWEAPFTDPIRALAHEACQSYPASIIDNEKSDVIFKYYDLGEFQAVATISKTMNFLRELYITTGATEHVKKLIAEKFLEKFKGKSIVLERSTNVFQKTMDGEGYMPFTFREDNLIEALPSAIATQYATNFEKAFAAGKSRALFLYGPPGAGKSTIAKQLAKELGLRSFRLRVEDLNEDNSMLFDIIDLFHPECIILDDFDRNSKGPHMLELIAHLRSKVKLIVATANDRNSVDEALLRPKRFDELCFVKTLDEGVVRKMLGVYADEAYELVKTWPIIFIEEYVERRSWLSAEEVKASFMELAARVERLSIYDESADGEFDSETEGFNELKRSFESLLKKKSKKIPAVVAFAAPIAAPRFENLDND